MALWLWLEKFGYPSIISKLVGISLNTINAVAQEAESCLRCLEVENFPIPNNGGLLLTTTILNMEISLQLFKLRRYSIIYGVKYVLNETCARIFDDILLRIWGTTCVSRLLPPYPYYRRMIKNVPGFPHPLFGKFAPTNFEEFDYDLFVERRWKNNRLFNDVEDEDKTMFLTFSKGFPVSREEVEYFFTMNYGFCIKDIFMGKRKSNGQVLDATMVVDKLETIDVILNGRRLAKFGFNGKHIWARKFDRRE